MEVLIINKFMPNVKMQLAQWEKSPKARRNVANNMSNQLQKVMLDIPEKTLNKKAFLDIIHEITDPTMPKVNFLPPDEDKIAYINLDRSIDMLNDFNYDHKITYKGYNMYVPEKDGVITVNRSILIHESRHLFDFMTQPKTIFSRGNRYLERDYFKDFTKLLSYIKGDGYKPKRILGIFKKHTFEDDLRLKLQNYDNDFVIDLLQRARYSVRTEIDAYHDMKKFLFKSKPFDINNLTNLLTCHIKNLDRFEFKHKEKVIKKLIKEYIQKERTSHVSALLRKDKNH